MPDIWECMLSPCLPPRISHVSSTLTPRPGSHCYHHLAYKIPPTKSNSQIWVHSDSGRKNCYQLVMLWKIFNYWLSVEKKKIGPDVKYWSVFIVESLIVSSYQPEATDCRVGIDGLSGSHCYELVVSGVSIEKPICLRSSTRHSALELDDRQSILYHTKQWNS